jgi:hypothetical protein
MTEAEWFACEDARDMVQSDARITSARKLRLFAVACCRCSRQLLLNASHRGAVDIAERFADGDATAEELADAYRRTNEIARALNAGEDWESEREIRRWAEAVAVLNATAPFTEDWHAPSKAGDAVWQIRRAAHRDIDPRLVALLRDIFGNPFRPVALVPAWLTSDVVVIARRMYESRDFGAMPILADALQDAGCDNDEVLAHCRGVSLTHVRGCWVVDLVLGKS